MTPSCKDALVDTGVGCRVGRVQAGVGGWGLHVGVVQRICAA